MSQLPSKKSPADARGCIQKITPEQCVIEERGTGTNQRHIRNILCSQS